MTTITINEKTKKGKMLLQFIKTMYENESFVSINIPNSQTLQAFDECQNKSLIKTKNYDDFLRKMAE